MPRYAADDLILIRHALAETGGRLCGRRHAALAPGQPAALAERAPPGGESFAAMLARAGPALADLAAQARASGPIAVVAHAGMVRTVLALALGSAPAALAFERTPLSVTRLRRRASGWSIVAVNGAP